MSKASSAEEELLCKSVRFLKGVGPKRASLLSKLGVETVEDLLYFFPRRYEDRRQITPIKSLEPDSYAALLVRVVGVEKKITKKRNLNLTVATVTDGTEIAQALWFNKRGLENLLSMGTLVALFGKIKENYGMLQILNPEFEIIEKDTLPEEMGKIVPIYPLTEGLSQRWLRLLIRRTLSEYLSYVEEFLPEYIVLRYGFPPIKKAILGYHYPDDERDWKSCRRRLAFDELFLLQLGVAIKRRQMEEEISAPELGCGGPLQMEFVENCLNFKLTSAQEMVLGDICVDIFRKVPMNRLLQGDVGSGKTVIAVLAMLAAVDTGYQAAMMVPTEVLANQHYAKITNWLSKLNVEVTLLTSSLTPQERTERYEDIKSGRSRIVIGTHSLIQEGVEFRELGLVVIDEQHRFGVLQRRTLMDKGSYPHTLVMTATPIPRTLALTVYGDLSLSIIDELPPGRTPVRTQWIGKGKVKELYEFVKEKLLAGNQAYWVCPLIDESESIDATSVQKRYQSLCEIFCDFKVGLLHGRLGAPDKDETYRAFLRGDLDILVATSVIEVGIDVARANIMVIEDAYRFGLSQLHQLRGRVGRGGGQGYCFLLGEAPTPEARKRFKVMCSTSDGFVIAEEDLKLRGPGAFCGVRQHGITDFRVADLVNDVDLLDIAREEARVLVENDPSLDKYPKLRARLISTLGETLSLAITG
jgi:ATP-dependent DNA helicase RecG